MFTLIGFLMLLHEPTKESEVFCYRGLLGLSIGTLYYLWRKYNKVKRENQGLRDTLENGTVALLQVPILIQDFTNQIQTLRKEIRMCSL